MYHLAKKINTEIPVRTIYGYISSLVTRSYHHKKPVYDMIEQHVPNYNYLHINPNNEFSNHYIVSDMLRGTMYTNLTCYNNILDCSHADIFAMKVDVSYLALYDITSEEQLAKHLITNLLDHLTIYTNNH